MCPVCARARRLRERDAPRARAEHERVDAPLPGVDVSQLPRMLATDRIAAYHDWPCGTIVRIERVFGGAEVVPYYRVVTAAQS